MIANQSPESLKELLARFAESSAVEDKELAPKELSKVVGGFTSTVDGENMIIDLSEEELNKILNTINMPGIKGIVDSILADMGLEGVEFTRHVELPKEKGEKVQTLLKLFLG